MKHQYESALSVAREQERIKKEVEDMKAAELAAMHQAASLIQRIYRGGHDREAARELAVQRKRAREEALAATDSKLFSLYSDGTNCLCIHIEWKCEEGISEAAARWHALQGGNTGGVQGVVVLALRAPEVVREEKRVRAQLEAEAEEARRQAWRALMEEERRKRVEAATLVIQRCVRWTQNRKRHMKKWHGKAKVNIVERKEDEVEECKRQLTRLKTSVYAAKGEIDHLERSVAAYRRQHEEAIHQLLELDAKCSSLEKARRAAISGDLSKYITQMSQTDRHTDTHTHTLTHSLTHSHARARGSLRCSVDGVCV